MILDASEICSNLSEEIVTFVHSIVLIIKIAVPIILVFFGMLDLGKGVIASKEDEIKKGQRNFIKRLIAGVVIFFMVTITQLVVALIDKDSNGAIWECSNKLLNGEAPTPIKTNVEFVDKNPTTFRYCCESLNGTIKDNICYNENGIRISDSDINRCANNIEKLTKENYPEEEKNCCQSLGGNYYNGQCKDNNGGTINQTNINACIVNNIKNNSPEIYKNCCSSKGGNYYNGQCVDSNGHNISDEYVNSCVLAEINK